MEVDLSGLDLTGVVSAALVQALPDDKREQLIQGAIKHLLTPERLAYGREKSPIEDAFEMAVRSVAMELIRAELQKQPEVILEIVSAGVHKAFHGENKDKLINRIAEQVCQGFKIEEW